MQAKLDIKSIESRREIASIIFKEWEKGYNYMQNQGYVSEIRENVNFYEGKQISKPKEKTKNIPRPMLNFTKLIPDTIASNVLGTEVKLSCMSVGKEAGADRFSQFFDTKLKEMQFDTKKEEAALSSLVKKNFIFYFYWNESNRGLKGQYKGNIDCDIIDPLDVIVANPKIKDTQKQEYIIIRKREHLKNVRAMAKGLSKEDVKQYIVADGYSVDEPYENSNEDEDELCTIYTKYFRKNGEVYWIVSTKDLVLMPSRPLNPNSIPINDELEVDEEKMEEDASIKQITDDDLETVNDRFIAWRYPIEIGCLEQGNADIYGLAVVRDCIPNQRLVNMLTAMVSKNIIDTAWDKFITKEGALKNQQITDEAGQVLVDHSKGAGWGITRLAGQNQLGNGVVDIVTKIIDLTRTLTNGVEYINNELLNGDISGDAIMRIEAIKEKNIDRLRKRFWRSLENCGYIIHQFCITYFNEGESFDYILSDKEKEEIKAAAQREGDNTFEAPDMMSDTFRGTDYENIPMNIVIEAGTGSRYSELAENELINSLFLNGTITKMSSQDLELFLELISTKQMSKETKEKLRVMLKEREASELAQTQKALEEAQLQNEALNNQNDDLKARLGIAKTYIDNLNKAYKEQLNQMQVVNTTETNGNGQN